MSLTSLGYGPLSFLAVIALGEFVRAAALKAGFCSRPVGDRWNKRSVPMGGGIAIIIALLVILALIDLTLFRDLAPALVALSVFGFLDDLYNFTPRSKLIFQTLVGWYLVTRGYSIAAERTWLTDAVSVLWIVFLTNALNLNDNMDGLCTGLVAVAASSLWMLLAPTGNTHLLNFALVTVGAAMGFLILNFLPARIFMGDSGSLPLGGILSILSLRLMSRPEAHIVASTVQVALVLCVLLFDVSFVITRRFFLGRSLFRGNIDHTSHRLVRAGLKEQTTVSLLHALAFLGGTAAVLTPKDSPYLALATLSAIAVPFTFLGTALLRAEKSGGPVTIPFIDSISGVLTEGVTTLRGAGATVGRLLPAAFQKSGN